jgi:biotin carboxyl carrier protein
MIFEVLVGGRRKAHRLEIEKSGEGWKCQLDGASIAIDAISPRTDVISIIVAGRSYEIKREQAGIDLKMWLGSVCLPVELRDPRSLRSRLKAGGDKKGPVKIVAPMPGRVVRMLVDENQEVEAGQGILVVEAMKMQNEIKSPKKGVVKKLSTSVGTAVNPGDVLATIE